MKDAKEMKATRQDGAMLVKQATNVEPEVKSRKKSPVQSSHSTTTLGSVLGDAQLTGSVPPETSSGADCEPKILGEPDAAAVGAWKEKESIVSFSLSCLLTIGRSCCFRMDASRSISSVDLRP